MVFDGLAQRRLASLLRPWLRQEPDLELKLGLLRSSGVAKNLSFDPAALNQQLFEQSDRWSVKDITVEQLSLRVSYWSVPTFTIEVQGVHVTLLGALDETKRSNDGGLQDRNKLIAEIDPEGAALHEVMQKLSGTDPRNSRKTSFLNVFLKRCQLKMQDIHLHVQFPVRNDYIGCFCEIKELCTESLLTEHGCFLRGLLSFPFAPLKESVFSIQVLGFEIGVKRKDHITCLMRPTNMLTRINLKDLQISDSSLNVPEITFSISLEALPIILAVCMLSSEKSSAGRSGRCLWNIAASRISSLVSNPRLSLHRSVNIVLLWLRYVKNYEDLLSLVGYPLDNSVEQSVARMSENGTFSVLVKNQWRIVSEIENELPSKAVARGRRIARHRAVVSCQQQRDNSKKLYLFGRSTFFRRFAILVELVWVIICKSVNSWLNLLLQVFSGKCEQLDRQRGAVPEDSCAWSCFGLNIGKISIVSSPVNKVGAFVGGTRTSEVNNSSLDLHGFGFSFHEFFLTSRVSICEQYLLISLGQIKVMSLPSTEDISKENSDYPEGHLRKKVHESKTILFSDPAEMFHIPEDSENAAPDRRGGSPISFLWDALGAMSSNWNFFRTKLEPTETQYSEGPWLLCEIKKHVMGQDFEDLNRGFCKFSSTVGKLNFLLDYSSLLSVVVFVKQIQHALVWTQYSRKANVLLPTQVTSEIPPFTSWEVLCDSYVTEIKKKIIEVLPQQHIQISVFIAGPSIQMTLQEGYIGEYKNESRNARQDDFHLTLAVHDIELAVWPTLRSDYVSPSVCQGLGGASPVCLGLIGSQEVYNTNGETYSSQGNISFSAYIKLKGLEAYLDDSSSNQQHGILVLHPSTVKLSALWEDEHSFVGANLIKLSASFHVMAAGFSVLFCMDEWFVPAKILADLFSTTSCNASLFDSYRDFGFQELMNRDGVHVEHEREPTKETVTELLSLNLMNTPFVVDVKFELKSTDLVLQNFRKCNNGEKHIMNFGAVKSKRLPMHDIPDDGISISVQRVTLEFSCGEEVVEVTANISELRCCIFRDKKEIFEVTDGLRRSNFLNSMSCLYEISLSHCAFALSVASPVNNFSSGSGNDAVEHCTSIGHMVADSSAAVEDNVSDTSYHLDHNFGLAPNGAVLASSHWLSLNIEISEIYTCGFPAKQSLAGAESLSKLVSSLLIGRGMQTIAVRTQGGSIILEPSAVLRFVDCFASYLHCIRSLVHTVLSSVNMVSGTREKMVVQDVNPREEKFKTAQHIIWEHLEACTVEFSQFSLSLVASDESGTLKQLQFEADFHSTFELGSLSRKFSLDLLRFSILSKINHEVLEKKIDIQSPHFASFKSSGLSPHSLNEDAAEVFQHTDNSVLYDMSLSSPTVLADEIVDDSESGDLHLSHQCYILKQLRIAITVENALVRDEITSRLLNQVWTGSGAITGLDVTISLPDVQMLMSTVESLGGVFNQKSHGNSEENHQSSNEEEEDDNLDQQIADGALVAIQDVDQHMYMTVEGSINNYSLVGATHYSLVGEKALFRVKYLNQKLWKSPTTWFSLISLYAKSDSGEPLELNYRPGSGFVDISRSRNGGQALWKMVPCNLEGFEGDDERKSYSLLSRGTFYLVNKKIDRGVSFVDGAPEFVSKLGNPFKWKIFHNFSIAHDIVCQNNSSVEAPSNLKPNDAVNDERNRGEIGSLPCIDIKIDKAVLTIAQELPDTRETFPLLQASISAIEFIVQILLAKARVMTTSSFSLCYFDAQNNLWREYIHPVEVRIFCRYGFYGSEVGHHRVPIHFYARIKEIGISITELSLDILLFVVGQLNLAGPYAIKTSTILGNCCKVENQSGLTLLCHFHGNQEASVAGKQSATFVLRHSAMANQPSESSSVSIQLADGRSYMTSPIHLALAEARSLAWRTRIVSPQDSKTYPGPFLVVDISRRSEDGLSVLVSPLLRIHNETKFSIELRFRRPQQDAAQCATVMLKAGDTIDDSVAAFDARKLSGESKKALLSLGVGNILLSFRPDISEDLTRPKKPVSPRWSDDLSGGKAVPISGVFDKLSYKVRKALLVEPMRYSFSIANCSLTYEDGQCADMHFLIQSIVRDVPVIQPGRDSPVALQEQKEIFILPTIRVLNLLQTEIHVVLSDTDSFDTSRSGSIGNQATIPCGSTIDFYADPATIYFVVTLTEFESSSKPLNSGDWVKKLHKQKNDIPFLDIDLDFGGGKYFSSLRLSRGYRGTLEVAIFTSYTVKNGTDVPLFCSAPNQKPLSRNEIEKYSFMIPPELGCYLPPMSTVSWFMKSNKARLNLLEEKSFEAMLDFDALSGLTEISLESEEGPGIKYTTKFGVSLGPFTSKSNVSAQMISVVPRYIVFNKSDATVLVRQCNLEDEVERIIAITSKQKIALKLQVGARKREMNVFDRILRKHKNAQDDSLVYIQFQPNVGGYGWSGPMCVASLGHFFLKFRKSSNFPVEQSHHTTAPRSSSPEYAAVQVVEENSSLVMYFHKPPNISLPYRIENNLRHTFITYYQKESSDTENLGSGSSVDYVWDDLTLPRRLVVKIHGLNLLREINLDKVRAWKPFHRLSQLGGLGLRFDSDRSSGDQRGTNFDESTGIQTVNVGYEVYADGPTRVLRFCELRDSRRQERFHSSKKIRLRLSSFALNLLEHVKQEADPTEVSLYKQILVARSGNICLDSVLTSMQKYNQIRMQSFSVEPKWVGSPFAATLRKHQSDSSDASDVLHLTLVLLSSSSNVRQVKYASVVIQPLDLNLDEETLMKVVPFWRVSLSDTKSQSQQYYFDHFEIHPIKIIASFLPGDSYSSYSSAQEMMRSLLHSVIKIPAIKSTTVELNGVLVTHALITIKELCIKCAQHYSWYATRAIYIAKGSPLLPPAFASIFDDSASSSLDVFFDPSSALTNLPGLTIGTFKLVRKCIDGKGFSGTKRYLGDLGKTVKTAGSNVLFAAVTEVSDSVLRGAEASGVNGMVSGFHQGIMKLAMEPSLLGAAFIGGGPDRKIVLDKSPGVDELYIEGYLQAMLDTIYKQEYLRVRVVENQVILKNLPPNSSLIEEVMDRVKGFLISKALLKGDPSTTSQPLRHLRGDNEWKIGPTVQTLCQHLFVSFAIRWLRRQTGNLMSSSKWKDKFVGDDEQKKKGIVVPGGGGEKKKFGWKWGIGKFMLSGLFAYIDGRLCRAIPQPVVRRIVSGFILSFLDNND